MHTDAELTDPWTISAEINVELEHYLAEDYSDIHLSSPEFFDGPNSGDITGSDSESMFDFVTEFEADSAFKFMLGARRF